MTTFITADREAAQEEPRKKEAEGEPIPFFGWFKADVKPVDSELEEKDHDRT